MVTMRLNASRAAEPSACDQRWQISMFWLVILDKISLVLCAGEDGSGLGTLSQCGAFY